MILPIENTKTIRSVQPWMTCIAMLLCLSLLAGCHSEEPSNTNQPKAATEVATAQNAVKADKPGDNQTAEQDAFVILALGDSLTEGLGVKKDGNYPALLEQALKQRGYSHIKVINSGFSGETSSGLKNRVDWVMQLKPDLTILNIGANDAIRGLPLTLTSDNITNIIERIQATGSEVILAGMQIYDNLGREYVSGFKDMYPKLAEQHDLVMIPFFLEHVGGDPALNQADMIHPTTAGYQVIVERNLLPTVLPVLNKLTHKTNHPDNQE